MDDTDISALTIDQVLKLLKQAGNDETTREKIEEDIKNGAPINEDGKINYIEYGAWVIKEMT